MYPRPSNVSLERILDASLNGIYVYDLLQNRNVYINRQYTVITGYTQDALDALDAAAFLELFHPAERTRIVAHLNRLGQAPDDQPFEIEYRFRAADGRWIWCRSRDSVFQRAADGRVSQFIGTFLDITERRHAETALRVSERRYRELVEQADSAILRWTSDGTITFINAYAQKLFGWPAAEAVGRHVGILVPAQETTGTDLRALVQDIVAYPERYRNNRNENVCRDGRRLWMSWANHALRDDLGQVTGILAIGNDVTELKRAEQMVRESETRLREAKRIAGLGYWEWDLRTDRHLWSEEIYRFYGRDPALPPAVYPEVARYFAPESWTRLAAAVEDALGSGQPYECDAEVIRPDGTRGWITARGEAILDAAGTPALLRGTVQDITESKRIRDALTRETTALREREEQLRFVLDGAELGFWDWNLATGRVERNERWAGMLGYRLGDIEQTDRQWTDLIHPDDRARAWDSIQAVLDGRAAMHKAEYRMLHQDGGIRWILDQAKVMQRDATGKPVRMCGTHTDITERKRLEEELRRQAHFDFLTQACSRGYFMEQAQREIALAKRYERPLSLLLLDLDFFKDINDRHGHEAGDQVLRHLGWLCRQVFRDIDIVGRLGGEEFAVLLPNTSEPEGMEAAERLRARVEETAVPTSQGSTIRFTISIGVATCCVRGDHIDALLKSADIALYDAKRSGRNRVGRIGRINEIR